VHAERFAPLFIVVVFFSSRLLQVVPLLAAPLACVFAQRAEYLAQLDPMEQRDRAGRVALWEQQVEQEEQELLALLERLVQLEQQEGLVPLGQVER
jgi:hypothetical protein